jgi:hypothetical protein
MQAQTALGLHHRFVADGVVDTMKVAGRQTGDAGEFVERRSAVKIPPDVIDHA